MILPARHLIILLQDGDCCKKQNHSSQSITWILTRYLKTKHFNCVTFIFRYTQIKQNTCICTTKKKGPSKLVELSMKLASFSTQYNNITLKAGRSVQNLWISANLRSTGMVQRKTVKIHMLFFFCISLYL